MMDCNTKLLKICLIASLCIGTTACNETVEVSEPESTETCNNDGTKDAEEACDGTDFGGKTCADYKGEGATGSLSCSECKIDSSNCAAALPTAKCGNNIKDGSDECDGSDFGSATCASMFGETATGQLSCSSDCKIISTGCTKPVVETCNHNDTKEESEECDGSDFGGKTCVDYEGEGATGSLVCNNCIIDSTACAKGITPNPGCGNNAIDEDEDCDGSLLGKATCASLFGNPNAKGTLACDAITCKFDTSDCAIDPCYTVICDEGTCEKGVCVTDAMKALKNGDRCDDSMAYCDGDVAVSCTSSGISRKDCADAGGCTVVDASKAFGDKLYVPFCRGNVELCKNAGDKVSYCATNSQGSFESYYYCYESMDGSVFPVDMASTFGIYSTCKDGCNAENSQCNTPAKLWCDYDYKCSNSKTLMSCVDNSMNEYELDIEEDTTTCDSGESCAVVNGNMDCHTTCTEESLTKSCKRGSTPNFGILTTKGCIKGDDGNLYSINKSTNCYAGCNETLDDCIKLSELQDTTCKGIGITSCDAEHDDVLLRCTLGRWGATKCAEGKVCGDLGSTNGGAQCYTPCDASDAGKITNKCIRDYDSSYGAFAKQSTSQCIKIGDQYVLKESDTFCDYSLCTSDGTQCATSGYAICPDDTELMSGETCGSYCAKQSPTARAIVDPEAHVVCAESCTAEGNNEKVFCVNNRKHTRSSVCTYIEDGMYEIIKSDTFEQCLDTCETGSNPKECNAAGIFTEGHMACDNYCRINSTLCADVCKDRDPNNLCAMTPSHAVECGLACNENDPDTILCEYISSMGKKVAFKATCTKRIDNSYMYITETSGTTCPGECTNGVGCVE